MALTRLMCNMHVLHEGGGVVSPSPIGGGLGRGSEFGVISLKININFAGGSPTAGYLSCFAKKGNPKKAPPVPPSLRDSLRCSTGQAAGELARSAARPRAQTVLADPP